MNYTTSARTEMATRPRTEVALSGPIPNDRNHPIWVYLFRLAPGSFRTMSSALVSIAKMGPDGADSLVSFRWPHLRYRHTSAIRWALAARYKPATANKMLAALRGVLKECQKLGWMSAEDFQRAVDIPILKATTLLHGRALTLSKITALQTACSRDPNAAGIRDAAIIGVLYGTGLRRSKVVNLDCSACKQDENELTVFSGKGRKDRLVYVPDGAREAMKDWLALRGSRAGPLFCHVNKAGSINLPLSPERPGDLAHSAETRRSSRGGIVRSARSTAKLHHGPVGGRRRYIRRTAARRPQRSEDHNAV
jgi:integrase